MPINIINSDDEKKSKTKLEKYYADNFIPAEKKPYVTALRKSVGPYMAIESATPGSTAYLQDAASQIATLGLGFNPTSFFGTAHFLEAWTNLSHTESFQELRRSFTQFLSRQLGWKNVFFRIGHSGAEANEMALGECFRQRHNKKAKRILAFEGSFHGRMMVTLSATWNKTKREPFEWPGFATVYCPSPELPDESMHQPMPTDWRSKWDAAPNLNWRPTPEWSADQQVAREIASLEKVREHLLTEEIFAVIIEPMQCEGGDRYLSDRFLTALLLMARSCGVPVILDEVQTGFHLGRKFFWHRQLELTDQCGSALIPNYVVCAKKAQVGLVISNTPIDMTSEEFQVASFIRGTIHAQILAQSTKAICELEQNARNLLLPLISKYNAFIHRPRCNGMAFAFDVKSEEFFNKFIDVRFHHGLLYYNAGTHTMRFRLNLSYEKDDLVFLFNELDNICSELFLKTSPVLPKQVARDLKTVDALYQWHEGLLELKLNYIKGDSPDFAISCDLTDYTMPGQWEQPPLHLCSGISSPLGAGELTADFMRKNLPSMVNKVCLSNFVSENYLENFKFLISLAPSSLQHAYSSSGQAECSDKIAKSFWYNTKKNIKNITFEGHFFGYGSFFSRSLGQCHTPYFPVSILPHPTENNWEQVLKSVQLEIEQGNTMAVWLEPIRQHFMDAVPQQFLKQLKQLCGKLKVPVVYNETISSFFRYHDEHFFAANHPELCPDAMMTYGGGQIGAVWMRQDLYVSKPLMLISTWDGDELSLSTYTEAIRRILPKKQDLQETRLTFNSLLAKALGQCRVADLKLSLGYGHFTGTIPASLQHLFSKIDVAKNDELTQPRYLICPNFDSMVQFIRTGGTHNATH